MAGWMRSRPLGGMAALILLLVGAVTPSKAEPASAKELEAITTRLQHLEERVAILQDVEEIRSLRQRYHEYVNEGRHARISELFAMRGVVDFGELGRRVGRDAIHTLFVEELINEDLTFIKQFNHNHAVEVSGDQATGSSYLEAKNVLSGQATLVAARYDDSYLRTAEGWRFQEMKLTLYFVTPLAQGWGEAAASEETR